jgi:hypothetical protein
VLCLALTPAWSALGESISYTSGAAPIYGNATVYGDTLLFNPTAYFSKCSGVNGVDMVDGQMRVWITCTEGIEDVSVEEGGAWFFFGSATDATRAYVGAFGAELFVTEVDGVAPTGPLSMIPGTMDFTPSSSDVGSRTFKATEPVNTAGWRGTMRFDHVAGALAGTPYQGRLVTGAMLVFDDILATASEAGTLAFIDKKWVSITTSPDPVPEPDSLVFLATVPALALAYRLGKRRKAELAAALRLVDATEKQRSGTAEKQTG